MLKPLLLLCPMKRLSHRSMPTWLRRNCWKTQHLVDAGYIDATNLIESQAGYGVDLVGPTLKIDFYQAETGYDLTHFSIDWQAQVVSCPQGHPSSSWTPAEARQRQTRH